MKQSQLSLKGLEVFRIAAQSGSVQITADRTGLSISTVSHHLRNLETQLGVDLLDHARRPMVVTAEGLIFLRYVEEALGLLDKAQVEVRAAAPHGLNQLRFAMIEDFENDIGPEITRMLAKALPHCRFTHHTRVSHEILDLLRNRDLDLGIATQPQFALPDVEEIPLLRDPFVLAVPATQSRSAEDIITGQSGLPFLRYSRSQIIGSMVEAQLTRLRLKLDTTFELDSTASIMALIAQGDGWAITTPSNYVRAKRFHGQVRLLPFPRKEFARTVSVFIAEAQAEGIARLISAAMRSLMSTHAIGPAIEAYPWLKDRFRLIPDDVVTPKS
ncbi:LysR family transcriptional regulator [Roseobacter sp. HKCCD9010]|uniref:LysR family transcriptional regulator n=1 Tax=unclassified Roseobacter TaxID=196798 RepID=UPI001491D053|nr:MULTISPECIES: LysR family transcriptional regulator [unclassified Roseobacter]MBF9050780.1 LysR family transcriptional regulator [Rhodobacterales bacterium HKCCD4356]NNV11802.1 LysR family transcriptional regulator [Roseobacter sp. HKCCD7357]NNV17953.1 LysR family transcriptional regulator [Roseobacter sp. HKCCD8768]NNV26044.1 LysR family transcriptional regulator [Roseobacter sp. HKCCD8192]NNV31680.1 LysR family transcriptional regulator [Roseobacter sp. HKCCD9061]